MSLKEHLQDELLARMRKNPRYSLRALARSLEVEPSALSKILSGKREITPRMFRRIATRLPLSPVQAKKLETTLSPREPKESFVPLSQDLFEVLSDWYHYALLELTNVDGFRPDVKWVARRLGIKPVEAKLAVDRLRRLNMLEIGPDGQWRDISGSVTTVGSNDYSASLLRNFQRRLLEQAIQALETVSADQRDQSAITMAISTSQLPVAKDQILRFRRRMCRLLQQSSPLDEVYTLAISLFPVSRPLAEKERKLP